MTPLCLHFVSCLFTFSQSVAGEQKSTQSSTSLQPRSVTAKDLRRRKRRFRKTSSSPPPTGNVQTLMEMGFPRKAVEEAVKALGALGNLNPSPESIVGWLLEHQDQVDLDVTITEEDETTDSDESKSFSRKKVINIQLKNDFF